MTRVTFSPIGPGGHVTLRPALDAARLPTDDINHHDRTFFELANDDGSIGFIGVEGIGTDRLLRSLVVLPGRRRRGYGGLLVAHAEATARRQGAERLHLLTSGAANFFRARGYRDGDRSTVPAPIAATAQFASLCPANATYLVKDLA